VSSKKQHIALIQHLDAGYNLARWLTRNEQDAQDVLQESFVRALRFFESLEEEDPKPWFLKIVRNTCYTWMKKNRNPSRSEPFDEETHVPDEAPSDPEFLLLLNADIASVRTALESLSTEYREALLLRELEGLTYEEISKVASVPIGTVMSRISRARVKVQEWLEKSKKGET